MDAAASGGGNAGLSTGAKAGIGVGAAAGAIAALAAVGILFYRRGQAAGRKGATGIESRRGAAAELGDPEPKPAPELGGAPVSEMYAPNHEAAELGHYGYDDYQQNPAELSAEPHGHPIQSSVEKV